ncbi:hypothetical protein DIPPA_04295 [Diplonema papillatum]|nr:hypothetical protein DIPPA_04295 [Diplonema papillatum]
MLRRSLAARVLKGATFDVVNRNDAGSATVLAALRETPDAGGLLRPRLAQELVAEGYPPESAAALSRTIAAPRTTAAASASAGKRAESIDPKGLHIGEPGYRSPATVRVASGSKKEPEKEPGEGPGLLMDDLVDKLVEKGYSRRIADIVAGHIIRRKLRTKAGERDPDAPRSVRREMPPLTSATPEEPEGETEPGTGMVKAAEVALVQPKAGRPELSEAALKKLRLPVRDRDVWRKRVAKDAAPTRVRPGRRQKLAEILTQHGFGRDDAEDVAAEVYSRKTRAVLSQSTGKL